MCDNKPTTSLLVHEVSRTYSGDPVQPTTTTATAAGSTTCTADSTTADSEQELLVRLQVYYVWPFPEEFKTNCTIIILLIMAVHYSNYTCVYVC